MNINKEFQSLIPALTTEEYQGLEQSILAEGCRDALIVWNDTLIDGHNRHEICTKHGISFKTVQKAFETREKVKEWIILNQFGRRNLSAYDRSLLALRLRELFAEKARANQGTRTDLTSVRNLTKVESASQQEPSKTSLVTPLWKPSAKPEITPIDTKKELAAIAGVSHDTISKVQKIEEKATEKVKEQIKQGEISINKAYKDIQVQERRQEIKVEKPKEINGLYDVIYVDPPWRYQFSETESRAIENQYPSMDLEDIKNIKVPSEENSVLLMWATAPKLEEALEVMKAWGYTYKTNAIWDKEIIGMGYWFRGQHELILVGVKGNFRTPDPENRYSSVYKERRAGHSKKPIYYYEIIEKMFPSGKYLEMFSRHKHNDKWEVWGNQCE